MRHTDTDEYSVTVVNRATLRKMPSRKHKAKLHIHEVLRAHDLTLALRKRGILREHEKVASIHLGPKIGQLEVSVDGVKD